MTSKQVGIVVMVVVSMLVGQSAMTWADDLDSTAQAPVLAPPIYVPPPLVRPPSAQPAMMLTLGGTLADLFTTLAVVNSGKGRELNPLLGSHPAQIIAMKSALLIPQLLAERHLARRGHPKAAMWLGIALGGFGTALAVHNMNVAR
jgi:ABC-type Fe2+-enterobactin transport system substrate-binding protein